MLKIKKSFLSSLPRFEFGASRPMQISPVVDDGDELTLAVQTDPDTHDNNWELNERPDEMELEKFWTDVEADVKKDASWFRFDD